MSILRLSHVEIRVPDLELATAYYSEVVGLIETAREPERVFLKCWDEHQHHSVVLTYAPTHGLNSFGFKVTFGAFGLSFLLTSIMPLSKVASTVSSWG